MRSLDILTAVLVIIGGINWGLVGIADFNLVAALFGQSALASIVYILVGVAAVYQAVRWTTAARPTPVVA